MWGEFKTVDSKQTDLWIAPFLNNKLMHSNNLQIKNKSFCKLFFL